MLKIPTLIATSSIVLAGLAAPVFAAPPGWTDHKDSAGNVYLGGTAPNGEIVLNLGNMSIKKSVRANQCGLAVIRTSATSPLPATFNIGATPVTVSSLTQRILPKCALVNGTYQLEEARTSTFKTIEGNVVAIAAPNATVEYTATGTVQKRLRANTCGFAKVSNSLSNPIPNTATFQAASGATGFSTATTFSSISTQTAWKCSQGSAFKPV